MELLPLAAYLSRTAQQSTALSALPNAPVVDDRPRPSRAPRLRSALAAGLHRAADSVAPRRRVPGGAAPAC